MEASERRKFLPPLETARTKGFADFQSESPDIHVSGFAAPGGPED